MTTKAPSLNKMENVEFIEIHNSDLLSAPHLVIGIDEVAVSPLAGPMVSCLVAMPKKHGIQRLPVDSKKLNDDEIAELAVQIEKVAHYISFASLEPEHVTIMGTHKTRLKLNRRNAEGFRALSDLPITLDGKEEIKSVSKVISVPQAESKNIAVSAASILAKHRTNLIMLDYHERYPYYGFDKNKGYETKEHLKGIREHGYCPIHRVRSSEITNEPMIDLKTTLSINGGQWNFMMGELDKVLFLKEEMLGEFGFKFFSNVRNLSFQRFTPKMKTCLTKIYFETLRRSKSKNFQSFDRISKMWIIDSQKLYAFEINRKTRWIIDHYPKIENKLSSKDEFLIKKLVQKKNKEQGIASDEFEMFQKICRKLKIS